VADTDSLMCVVRPCDPTWAGMAGPWGTHWAPDFCQACRVAVVLPIDGATTVITWVAVPVDSPSGRPGRAAGGADRVDGGAGCVEGGTGWVGMRRGGRDADVVGLAAVLLVVAGRLVTGGPDAPWPARTEAHALRLTSAAPTSAQRRKRTDTPSGCHATPMRMRGWVAGVSHLMTGVSRLCAIATQPAVARPSVTCRKNALPRPARTPPGALRVL
jgi:hypothetical protein